MAHLFGFRAKRTGLAKMVTDARSRGDKAELARALRTLGEFERKTPFTQAAALKHYEESVAIFRELDDALTLAHTVRHLGLVHEDAGRLDEAEKYYDEALALYREHEREDSLDYANAVRYPAVIKGRLGKTDESAVLWEEAHERYARVGIIEGVAESAAHLTVLALDGNDPARAVSWFARASEASERSHDPDTHKFIDEVRVRVKKTDE